MILSQYFFLPWKLYRICRFAIYGWCN
uniref:Uncharacterized protein n=1 Tax=Rhizophora mucronata TaxID=61149 RepID=A0A2P2QFE8_RHIMU